MGQITVRIEDRDLKEMDNLMHKEGLATRSEVVRKALNLFKAVKKGESEGKVAVMMPAEQLKSATVQLVV
jgi:metal-responsive CopG/Arc/MetJ family transcriptional regulator